MVDKSGLITRLKLNKFYNKILIYLIINVYQVLTIGGAIEIQAACNIWNLQIIVINIRDKNKSNIEFIPIHNNISKKIYLEWSGGHYEPVRN